MSKTDGEPAFPCNSPDGLETYSGMTLRDYFAATATDEDVKEFMGFHQGDGYAGTRPTHTRVQARYLYADSMILERDK